MVERVLVENTTMANDKSNGKASNGKANDSATEAKKPRAATDWAAKLDEAEIRRDGLQMRWDRSERELNRIIGNHPDAEKIRQVFKRAAFDFGRLQLAGADVERAYRLMIANSETEATEAPTTPPTDSENEAAAASLAAASVQTDSK